MNGEVSERLLRHTLVLNLTTFDHALLLAVEEVPELFIKSAVSTSQSLLEIVKQVHLELVCVLLLHALLISEAERPEKLNSAHCTVCSLKIVKNPLQTSQN